MTRRAIVAANWKMNGNLALVQEMSSAFNGFVVNNNVEIVICPSFPYLAAFATAAKNENLSEHIHLGAQNVNAHDKGAFTGEISTAMLKDISAEYVIVGHSERRSLYNETSFDIALKVKSVLEAGLIPILCIGENAQQYDAGITKDVLNRQLQESLNNIDLTGKDLAVAYEPVWAIGTGKTATPSQAQAMHKFVRQLVSAKSEGLADSLVVLYGGSVNADNAETLFSQEDIDGALVGGASLKVEAFSRICEQMALSN